MGDGENRVQRGKRAGGASDKTIHCEYSQRGSSQGREGQASGVKALKCVSNKFFGGI